jgi:hypothetical protein
MDNCRCGAENLYSTGTLLRSSDAGRLEVLKWSVDMINGLVDPWTV